MFTPLALLNVTEDKLMHIRHCIHVAYDINVIENLTKEKEFLDAVLSLVLKELRQ